MAAYADIRKAIRDRLLTAGHPVFWGWTAPKDEAKPHLTMNFTGELPSINTPCGKFSQFEVLIYGEEGNIFDIDPLADEVVELLDRVDLSTPTGIIRPEYRRDSRIDDWDEEKKASVIRLMFWLPL